MTEGLLDALLKLPARMHCSAVHLNPYIINSHYTRPENLAKRGYLEAPAGEPVIAWVAKAREHHLAPFLNKIYTGTEERLLRQTGISVVVWWCEEMPISFAAIVRHFPVKFVIAFGIDHNSDLSLQCEARAYSPVELCLRDRKITFLKAEALSALHQSSASKKHLWNALKAIFTSAPGVVGSHTQS